MAFAHAPGGVLARHSVFTAGPLPRARRASARRASGARMGLTDKERQSFAKIGSGSKWRENIFVGGFPGGEEFYLNWVDKGMGEEVPDLPEYLQPKKKFEDSKDSRRVQGVLERLDATEFFPAFFGKGTDTTTVDAATVDAATVGAATVGAATVGAATVDAATVDDATPAPKEDAPPDESLYERYFPADRRNLAPMISMVYENDFYKDRVSVAMREVTANATEVHFPREYSGKAPIISISYNGNLATASVSVRMADIAPLPTIAPPVANGETVTKLVPGPGGGLKLDFEVQGSGPVNVYSDPRCIEKFESMLN